ncbi:MAG: hypothetical protein ACI8RD_005350 [Bacillariaceae sp.]|jgi:hypothetical protein
MTDSFPLYFSYFVDRAFLVINIHKNAHGKPTKLVVVVIVVFVV